MASITTDSAATPAAASEGGILRLAAFAIDSTAGGNPAGVLIADSMPEVSTMQATAAAVGYSETVFSAPEGPAAWRVRYFALDGGEVSFCGHATIALGAALAQKKGDGVFDLRLNDGVEITVEGRREGDQVAAALQSPPTTSVAASAGLISDVLDLFGLSSAQLDPRIPVSIASAGSTHLVVALKERATLASMAYDLEAGRQLMTSHGLLTIQLLHAESDTRLCARCAFASGGVYEDAATGSAAASLGGLLRDIKWPHHGRVEVVQGVEMGMPSRLVVEITDGIGESIKVSGIARAISA